jgi:UDP-glucose 4-epimerase
MKLLVTGGAGYVGSHTVRALCNSGHDVVVIDNLQAGHAAAVDSRATLNRCDLADVGKVEQTVLDAGIDGVLHFAASIDVGESVRDPLTYYQNNVVNTINLLRVLRDAGVKRFVFSSTCATYGEPPEVPIVESMPQQPINPYGHTKLAMEWALSDSARAWGLGSTALRYFNASGASSDATIGEDHDPEFHLIPVILQVALGQRESIKIFGTDYDTPDGTCIRDYIHVEDLATAHVKAIETQPEGVFRFYNVGTGVGSSVREVIEAARRVTGHDIAAQETERRPGDPPSLYANADKIKKEFDWHPRYTNIEETIATAWRWHESHPHGYDD